MEWKNRLIAGGVVESTCRFGVFKLSVESTFKVQIGIWVWTATVDGVLRGVELKSPNLLEARAQAKAKLQVALLEAIEQIEQPLPPAELNEG